MAPVLLSPCCGLSVSARCLWPQTVQQNPLPMARREEQRPKSHAKAGAISTHAQSGLLLQRSPPGQLCFLLPSLSPRLRSPRHALRSQTPFQATEAIGPTRPAGNWSNRSRSYAFLVALLSGCASLLEKGRAHRTQEWLLPGDQLLRRHHPTVTKWTCAGAAGGAGRRPAPPPPPATRGWAPATSGTQTLGSGGETPSLAAEKYAWGTQRTWQGLTGASAADAHKTPLVRRVREAGPAWHWAPSFPIQGKVQGARARLSSASLALG